MICLVIAGQLAYPQAWLLPVIKLGDRTYYFASKQDINQYAASLSARSVTIKTETKSYTSSIKDLGVRYDAGLMAKQLREYPLASRCIPFSILWQGLKQQQLAPRMDDMALKLYANRVAEENYVQPIDAGLAAKNGELLLVPQKSGKQYSPVEIQQQIQSMLGKGSGKLELKPALLEPKITDGTVKELIQKAQKQINSGLSIEGGARVTPNRATLASWYRLSASSAGGPAKLGVDGDAVQKYLATVQKQFYVAPGVTTVNLVDGAEASRVAGEPGWGVDGAVAGQQILAALNKGTTSVQLSRVALPPTVTYTRTYSNSQAGLQALLNDLVAAKGAYGIAVREISDRGWSASASGSRKFVTASTYKLFVAYSTLKRIESGEFSWADATHNTDLATCFDRMIINSDNPCAEALGVRIGWSTVISEMNSLGLSSTLRSNTFYSTAEDEALLLVKLARGQILTSASRERLISVMKQQVFRAGIPAGTGAPVADKVGFLWSYLNDAAIVYAPKSTYVLVILTSGSSWSQIADTARQINTQMNR